MDFALEFYNQIFMKSFQKQLQGTAYIYNATGK